MNYVTIICNQQADIMERVVTYKTEKRVTKDVVDKVLRFHPTWGSDENDKIIISSNHVIKYIPYLPSNPNEGPVIGEALEKEINKKRSPENLPFVSSA